MNKNQIALIKQTIFFIFIILVGMQHAHGQIKLSGKLENPDQNYKVYLMSISELQHFLSRSNDLIIDSSTISKEGIFSLSLEANTIYRLNIAPIGTSPGLIIQDGVHDNYAYVITGNNLEADIFISANINNLFLTYKVNTDDKITQDLNNDILSIRKIMLPMYQTLENFGTQMKQIAPTDTAALMKFQQNAFTLIKETRSSIINPLTKFMSIQKNEHILALAAAFYGIDMNANTEEIFLIEGIFESYKNKNVSPLLQSVLDKIKESQRKFTLEFLDKDYLLIDGKTFNISSIKSDYILLNFWASWCLPCRKSIRTTLKQLSEHYDTDQLMIIGINTDEDKNKAIEAIKLDENKHVQIYDGTESFLQNYMYVSSLPTYILIDVKNKTVQKWPIMEQVKEALENRL